MMKIIEDPQVRFYELTYLVPENYTETEISKLKDEVGKLISRHRGKIIATEDWGKKKLAYKIRHKQKMQGEASYIHQRLEFESVQAHEFERDLSLNSEIMRHLMVKAGETQAVPVTVKSNEGAVDEK